MQSVTVRNREQGPVIVRQIASAFFSLKAMSYYLTHFHGSSNAEMWLKEELLTPGIKTIDSKKGVRTTHNENSCFIVSVNGPAKEDDGEVYGGALAWSGNFESSFQLDDFNMLQIRCGLNPFCSEIRLLPVNRLRLRRLWLDTAIAGRDSLRVTFTGGHAVTPLRMATGTDRWL